MIKTVAMGVAAAMLALSAPAASASDLGRSSTKDEVAPVFGGVSWTGFYVGGQAGYSNSNHEINASNFYKTKGTYLVPGVETEDHLFADGLNSPGFIGGVNIGADVQRGNFVFGAFAEYNWANGEFNGKFNGSGQGFDLTSIEEGDSWLVAARAGILLGQEKRTLFYGLVGYSQKDMTYGILDGKIPHQTDATFSGIVAGGGIEHAITSNVRLGLEYRHFFGDEQTVYDSRNTSGHGYLVTDKLDSDEVMLKLKVQLNGGLF